MPAEKLAILWPRFFGLVSKSYVRIRAVMHPTAAYRLVRLIDRFVEKAPEAKEMFKMEYMKVEEMRIDCAWIGIPALRQEEVEELFATHVARAWELMPEYDLPQAVKGFLLTIVLFDDRDALKKKLREGMERAQVALTTKPFFIGGTRPAGGTLGNWLADYRKFVGAGEPPPLVLTTYLTTGSNMRRLDAREREKMKQIFKLYVQLGRSSKTPEGIEEDIPVETPYGMGVVRDGEFIKYEETAFRDPDFWTVVKMFDPKAAPPEASAPADAARKAAVEAYQGDFRLREAIEKEEKKWNEFLRANPSREAIFGRLYDALAPARGAPSVHAAMGALLAAGKAKGLLREFLKSDRRAVELLKTWLGKEGEAQMRDYLLSPVSPPSLALFLRALCERKLGLDSGESARLGLHIANALKRGGFPEYMTMAHYDAGGGEFRWGTK